MPRRMARFAALSDDELAQRIHRASTRLAVLAGPSNVLAAARSD
jgi:hypothetical protein